MATSSDNKFEGFDPDDLDAFLNGIQAVADEVGVKSTKTVVCYLCKSTVEMPLTYRLNETCPGCYEMLRDSYVNNKQRIKEWGNEYWNTPQRRK